ncbi:MAG: hypothetical protein M1816_003089 [Peltula sp. TS41687]|nr:MAG: hypothetical protein M1816_003089 [Peltula sp. TS41687]
MLGWDCISKHLRFTMSFGFSISDVLTLVQLTSRTYNGWKNACGEYTQITRELATLDMILVRVEAEAKAPTSLLTRDAEDLRHWDQLSNDCRSAVAELDKILQKYKSLGTSHRRNWDRIRMGNKNLDELRRRLAASTTAISAFLNVLGMSSQGRVENEVFPELLRRVNELAVQMRAGKSSIRSSLTAYDDDDKEVWREFRRDLINGGFRSAAIRKYSAALKTYIGQLHRNGLLDEEVPEEVLHSSKSSVPLSSNAEMHDDGSPKAPLPDEPLERPVGDNQDIESKSRRGADGEKTSSESHDTRLLPKAIPMRWKSPSVEDDPEDAVDDGPNQIDHFWQNEAGPSTSEEIHGLKNTKWKSSGVEDAPEEAVDDGQKQTFDFWQNEAKASTLEVIDGATDANDVQDNEDFEDDDSGNSSIPYPEDNSDSKNHDDLKDNIEHPDRWDSEQPTPRHRESNERNPHPDMKPQQTTSRPKNGRQESKVPDDRSYSSRAPPLFRRAPRPPSPPVPPKSRRLYEEVTMKDVENRKKKQKASSAKKKERKKTRPQAEDTPLSTPRRTIKWEELPRSELHPIHQKPELPEGWDWRIDDKNRLFYVDTYARGSEKRCFWKPPKEEVDLRDVPGWDRICTVFGRVYWVHRESKIISYEHPDVCKQFAHAYPNGTLYLRQGSWEWGFVLWSEPNYEPFVLDDTGVACQISHSVWQNGLSDEAVEKRGALWWWNPGVREQNLRLTAPAERPSTRIIEEI